MKSYPWVKLSTEFFEDPKILRLQTYPEKEFLLVFWIRLVILSLKRSDGLLLIDEDLPYSVTDFIQMFRKEKEENTIRMALSIFEKLGMVSIQPSSLGEVIGIRSYNGFEDVESLEHDRLKNRERQSSFRKRQRESLLRLPGCSGTEGPGGQSQGSNALLTDDSRVSNEKVTGQTKTRQDRDIDRDEEILSPTPSKPIFPRQGNRYGVEKLRTSATESVLPDEKSEPKGVGPQSRQVSREADPGSAKGDGSQSRQREEQSARDTSDFPKDDPVDLPDWLPRKDWNDFLEVRKSLGCPMTGISRARTLEALERLRDAGHDPGEVLNQSIVNGWKGVFPVRKTRGSVPGPQKTFDQIKVEKTRSAANRVLDEIYGPKENSNGTISI